MLATPSTSSRPSIPKCDYPLGHTHLRGHPPFPPRHIRRRRRRSDSRLSCRPSGQSDRSSALIIGSRTPPPPRQETLGRNRAARLRPSRTPAIVDEWKSSLGLRRALLA